MSNNDYRRNIAAQVEQSMQFDGPFAFAKVGPGKKREAQIDSRRIERVNRLLQSPAELVVPIKRSRLSDQQVSEVGINAPIAHRVGVGQRVARDASANAHVIELGLIGPQTSFDVAQAFAIG